MQRDIIRLLSLFIVTAIWPATARGADPPWLDGAFQGTAAEVRAAAAALPELDVKPAPLVDVYLDEETLELTGKGEWRHSWRRVYRVLSAQGLESSRLTQVVWTPWYEKRPILKARVISTDGVEHRLSDDTISEAPLPSPQPNVFSTRKLVQAPLPALEVGALVETLTVLETSKPFFDAGVTHQLALGVTQPTRVLRRIVTAPKSLTLRHNTQGEMPRVNITDDATGRRLEVRLTDARPLSQVELFRPSTAPPWPVITVATGQSWRDVGAAYYRLIEDTIDPAFVEQQVTAIVGDEEARSKLTRRVIIHRLLDQVRRRIRYTGLAFGAQSIVPYHPEKILERRFGDCKDQSILLISMLRAAGVEADIALVRVSDQARIETELPGMNQFDHAIVRVRGEPPVWIDPTADNHPPGQLPPQASGRQALVVSKDDGRLMRTTPQSSQASIFRTETTITVADDGFSTMQLKATRTGAFAAMYRTSRGQMNDQQHRDMLLKPIAAMSPQAKISRFKESAPNPLGGPHVIESDFERLSHFGITSEEAQYVQQLGGLMNGLPITIIIGELNAQGERTDRQNPLQLPLLVRREERVVIAAPAGFRHRELPKDETLQFGPLTITTRFRAEADHRVVFEGVMDTGDGLLTAEQARELRNEVKSRFQSPGGWSAAVGFDYPAFKLIAQGKHGEGLRMLRDRVVANPEDVSAQVRYAIALMRSGFAISAKHHARRAAELAPDRMHVQANLAWALSHDDLGRLHARDCDWSEAERCYRTAIQLDRMIGAPQSGLSQLLLSQPSGRRFANKENEKAAIQLLDETRLAQPANAQIQFVFLEAAMLSGRMKEAHAASRGLAQDPRFRGPYLTAVAVEQGVREAAAQIASFWPNERARQSAFVMVAGNLVNSRQYETAVALARLAPNNPALQEYARMAAKLKRREGPFDLKANPENAVREVYRRVIMGHSRESIHERLFVNSGKAKNNSFITRAMRRYWSIPGSPQAAADALVLESTNVESSASGRIHRVTSPGFLTWWVVRFGDAYRVQAVGEAQRELGDLALARITAGDLKDARFLLDAAFEELRSEVNVFDSFSGSPFARYWTLMRSRFKMEDEPQAKPILQTAAAMLAITDAHCSDEALAVVTAASANASSDLHKLQYLRTLGAAYAARKDYARVEQLFGPLALKHADEYEVVGLYAFALIKQSKHAALQEYRRRKPDAFGLAGALAKAAKTDEEFREIATLVRDGADQGSKLTALLFSQFDPNADADWLKELAAVCLPARELSGDGRHGERWLHMAAALHTARTGDVGETMKEVDRSLRATGRWDEDAELFVVYGRLAESLALPEVAAEAYRRVPKQGKQNAGFLYYLAQSRLKRLKSN